MLSFKICYISHISRWHSSVYSSLDLPYDAVVMQGRLTYLHPCQSHPFCHFCFIFGRYDYIIISCVYGCAYMCLCVCVCSQRLYMGQLSVYVLKMKQCACVHVFTPACCQVPDMSAVSDCHSAQVCVCVNESKMHMQFPRYTCED